jgi:hypothetical protein
VLLLLSLPHHAGVFLSGICFETPQNPSEADGFFSFTAISKK